MIKSDKATYNKLKPFNLHHSLSLNSSARLILPAFISQRYTKFTNLD